MERELNEVKIGALCWNQYADWPSLLEAGRRADRLGYHSLWTWDHLYPIVGSSQGPMFEAWMTLAAWAQATERVRIGLMVGANTFREPALRAAVQALLARDDYRVQAQQLQASAAAANSLASCLDRLLPKA